MIGRAVLSELVMAWARDIQTGEPRYILELDADHRGAQCGCECPSCGLALTGVNVARNQFLKRPHFRHPDGAPKDGCAVLAARSAALRLFSEEGLFELPRRRMSAAVAGLTGELHQAWVEVQAEKVRIRDINFQDRAFALLTLQDGRQLRVQLTGTLDQAGQPLDDGSSSHLPIIFLDINDSSIAGMEPEEIRRRLQLLPDSLCWRSHWQDAALLEQAAQAARCLAEENLDWWSDADSELPFEVPPELRRETLLHLTVKRILQEAGELWVPELRVSEVMSAPGCAVLRKEWCAPERGLLIKDVRLEQRSGRIIPDVVCEAWDDDGPLWNPFFIEVTVTNTIGEDRQQKIMRQGVVTLEIDLSLTGGRVNRQQLQQLVVSELSAKRWLYYPGLDARREQLRGELAAELSQAVKVHKEAEVRRQSQQQRRAVLLAVPTSQVRAEYLTAVEQMFVYEAQGQARAPDKDPEPRKRLDEAIEAMILHGYPQANHPALIGRHGLLAGLLSIQHDRSIGYRQETFAGVLQTIRRAHNKPCYWSVYFIAMRAYKPALDGEQHAWLEQWVDEVRTGIRNDEPAYLRPSTFDATLSHLFPEMAQGLAKHGGKLSQAGRRSDASDGGSHGIDNGVFLQMDRFYRSQLHDELDQATSRLEAAFWLKGAALEAWKRAHPEAAKLWESTLKNRLS